MPVVAPINRIPALPFTADDVHVGGVKMIFNPVSECTGCPTCHRFHTLRARIFGLACRGLQCPGRQSMSVDNLHQVPARADTNSPSLSNCRPTTTRPGPRCSNGRSGPARRPLFSHPRTVGAGTERCGPGCAVCYQSPLGAECIIRHSIVARFRCSAVHSQSVSTFRPRIQRLLRSYR